MRDDFHFHNKQPIKMDFPPWFLKMCLYLLIFFGCYLTVDGMIDNKLESLGLKVSASDTLAIPANSSGINGKVEEGKILDPKSVAKDPTRLKDAR